MIPRRTKDAADFVQAASASASETSLRTVAPKMRRYRQWLSRRHPYRDAVAALDRSASVDPPKLGEYIAASAPLHLTDGWNYLSQAFGAVAHGDRYTAYHLAYYAELRAAMALLASEGIGVFNRRHIALDGNLAATEFRGNTHRATWAILSAWSEETGRATRLLDSILLGSQSLGDWLEDAGVSQPVRTVVAKRWLEAWSVDLRLFSRDTVRRNELSYRPTRIQTPVTPVGAHSEMVTPLLNAWTALEPVTSVGAALDPSLLREALRFVVDDGRSQHQSLDDAIAALKDKMPTALYAAVSHDAPNFTEIFANAAIESAPGPAATPVLARALLMLRLASAGVAAFLSTAPVTKADLEFWWMPFGVDLGLWASPPEDTDELSDLWADVERAIEDAEGAVSQVPDGEDSVHAISAILSRDPRLTQFSRAPLWLLGLDDPDDLI